MRNVVDASVVLAVCNQEAGSDEARNGMRYGLISTVNLSEVFQKSMERGKLPIAQAIIRTAGLQVVEFDEALALRTAEIAARTRKKGISFADRACMALGMAEEKLVLTGDRKWLEFDIGVKVESFRPEFN